MSATSELDLLFWGVLPLSDSISNLYIFTCGIASCDGRDNPGNSDSCRGLVLKAKRQDSLVFVRKPAVGMGAYLDVMSGK